MSSSGRFLFVALVLAVGGVICFGQCPVKPDPVDAGQPKAVINPPFVGDSSIQGKITLKAGIKGTVQVCVDGAPTGDGNGAFIGSNGDFRVTTTAPLTLHQKITAQFIPAIKGNNPGPPSEEIEVIAPPTKALIPPVLSPRFVEGTITLRGHAQASSKIYICIWPALPGDLASLDCRMGSIKPAGLNVPKGEPNTYVVADKDDNFTAQLGTALEAGQYVSLVEDAGASEPAFSQPIGVRPMKQCNKKFNTDPYGDDCDLSLSLIGGVEQSAQSSSQSETTPFLRLFTRTAPWDKKQKPFDNRPFYLWAYVRLLGAPTNPSTEGVVSVVSNPSGTLSTQTFSTIGTSIDFMVGAEYRIWAISHHGYSVSAILGYGSTTPLQSSSLALAYTAPAFGTVECPELYKRFPNQFANDLIIQGTANNTTGGTASCLVNTNNPTTSSSGTTTYAPIKTIGFSNQDRASFLGKDIIGIRTMDRFFGSGNKACGDTDIVNNVGPCERGIVDFTVGHDASITGGKMANYIFKIDAVHTLAVPSLNILYLFGSTSIRITRNKVYAPLILQSANVASLNGTGTSSVPNPSTVVLSLVPPDRDYYRFGVGISINQIFTKLYAAAQTVAAGGK